MARIAVLDQNMINMIAAGEVIERPASVVKELMENGLDAGAGRITVTVEQGGRRLISVTDNGRGMDAEDLALAFEPHATSKVRTSEDLRSIATYGFRGEALASIAAVAQIRAVSRTADSVQAHAIEIDCGQRGQVVPCSGDQGTAVTVRDLFYRLPARQKFLRTAQTEMDHVAEQFIRMALGVYGLHPADTGPRPDLALIHNGREVYRLPADQGLRQRVLGLFPSLAADETDGFVELQATEKTLHVLGLLGRPQVSRANNKLQYVFLNGRFIRDKFITHAVHEAYRGLLEPDRHPAVFLFIRMPPEEFDVNVHPTKIEVRFYEANRVHSQILGVLRERLLGQDLSMPVRLTGPVHRPSGTGWSRSGPPGQGVADAMADFFKTHRPGLRAMDGVHEPAPAYPAPVTPRVVQASEQSAPSVQTFVQIHDSYIVVQTEDGLAIVDQHALHEKILYEKLTRRVREEGLESQRLLIPQTLALADHQVHALEAHAELVAKLGIEIVPFGPRSYAIHAFPTLLDKADPAAFVQDLADLLETREGPSPDQLLDEVLSMAACKAAIKAGQRLSDHEVVQLLADGRAAESSVRCPHGRPTTITLTLADLHRQFLRT